MKNFSESFVSVCLPLQLFETANKYHFYHSLALLGAAHCGKPAVVSIETKYQLSGLDALECSLKLKWCDSVSLSSLIEHQYLFRPPLQGMLL